MCSDAFFYHIGHALEIPYFLSYAMMLYSHLFIFLIVYSIGWFASYLAFCGLILYSTLLDFISTLCFILCLYNQILYNYVNKKQKVATDETKVYWKVTFKKVNDFTSLFSIISVVGLVWSFMASWYYGSPSYTWFISFLAILCSIGWNVYTDVRREREDRPIVVF